MKKPILSFLCTLTLLLWASSIYVSPVSGDCSQIFEYLVLHRHNEFRLRHGVQGLSINATLTRDAQLLANRMKAENQLIQGSPIGENLYAYWHPASYSPDANKAVDRWYSEVAAYSPYFGSEPDLSTLTRWIHFTNLIWRDTTEIGIGCSVSKSEETSFLVVKYYPLGNTPGEYTQNVLPMLEASTAVTPNYNSYPTYKTTVKSVTTASPIKYPLTTPSTPSTKVYPTTTQYPSTTTQYVKPSSPIYSSKPVTYSAVTTSVYQKPTTYLTTKPAYTTQNKYTTAKTTTYYQKPVAYSTVKPTVYVSTPSTTKTTYCTTAKPTTTLKPIIRYTTKIPYSTSTVYPTYSTTFYQKPTQYSTTKAPYVYISTNKPVYQTSTQYLTTKVPYSTPNKPYTTLDTTVHQKPTQYMTTKVPYYTSSKPYTTLATTTYQNPTESIQNVIYNPPYNNNPQYNPLYNPQYNFQHNPQYNPPQYVAPVQYTTTTTTTTTRPTTVQPAYLPPNKPFGQLIIHHGPYGTVFDSPVPIYNPMPYRPNPQQPNGMPLLNYNPENPYQGIEIEKPNIIQVPSNAFLPVLPVKPVNNYQNTYNGQMYRPPKPIENVPEYAINQYRPPKPIVINPLPDQYRPPQSDYYVSSTKKPLVNYYYPPKPVASSTAKPNYGINYYIPPEPVKPYRPLNNFYFPPKPVTSRPTFKPFKPQIVYRPPKPIYPGLNKPNYTPQRPKPVNNNNNNDNDVYDDFNDHDADDLLETAFELANDYEKKDKEKIMVNKKGIQKNHVNLAKKNKKIKQLIITHENNENDNFDESDILKKEDFDSEKFQNVKIDKIKKTAKSKPFKWSSKSGKLEKFNKNGKSKRDQNEADVDTKMLIEQ